MYIMFITPRSVVPLIIRLCGSKNGMAVDRRNEFKVESRKLKVFRLLYGLGSSWLGECRTLQIQSRLQKS